jgi:hypothetical protein
MHVLVRYDSEGVVVLSEKTAQKLCDLLNDKVEKYRIDQKNLLDWVSVLCELSFHSPEVSGQRFDITDFFKDDPEGVHQLISMLRESLDDMEREGELKGKNTIVGLIDKLGTYADFLRSSKDGSNGIKM